MLNNPDVYYNLEDNKITLSKLAYSTWPMAEYLVQCNMKFVLRGLPFQHQLACFQSFMNSWHLHTDGGNHGCCWGVGCNANLPAERCDEQGKQRKKLPGKETVEVWHHMISIRVSFKILDIVFVGFPFICQVETIADISYFLGRSLLLFALFPAKYVFFGLWSIGHQWIN